MDTRQIAKVKARLLSLLDDVLMHDGYGSIRVDIRLLKKGQKEVILDCGKQYRFVVDVVTSTPDIGAASDVP